LFDFLLDSIEQHLYPSTILSRVGQRGLFPATHALEEEVEIQRPGFGSRTDLIELAVINAELSAPSLVTLSDFNVGSDEWNQSMVAA
jgi:hypothetical protein